MVWKIEVKENIRKFLKKLKNEEINKRFEFVVESFKMNPLPKEKKHILDVRNGIYLCEFGIDKYRFYYEIHSGKIIIDKLEFDGKVIIDYSSKSHKSGSKKNYSRQQTFINWLKKKFKKKFR